MALNKFNPKKVAGNWGGIKFIGLMSGKFVDVEYDENAVTTHVSNDGIMSVVLNPNTAGKAKVTIIQGSVTNDDLAKLVPNSKRNSLPTNDFYLEDLNGKTVVHSKDAFIEKMTKIEFGNEILGREWTFILPDAEIVPGGADPNA